MGRPRLYANNAEKQRHYREKRNESLLRNVKRPPLRWLGSKWRVADWIIRYFPPHTLYVEPFGGGASALLKKRPSNLEVYNDLDGGLVNFFRVLREDPDKLIRLIDLTPYARQEFELSKELTDNPVEQARRFYVRSRMSFQMGSEKTGWRIQKEPNGLLNEFNETDHLYAIAARFKPVMIECQPANDIIQRFDTPKTLFYCDPPYLTGTRTSTARYSFEISDEDHVELACLLRSVRGMVIVSGYDSPLYNELYGGWRKVSKETLTNGNAVKTEYLWLSPRVTDNGNLPLFASHQ